MIQEANNSSYYPEKQNNFNIKKFFFQIFQKWYWFVISVFVGLLLAWLSLQFLPPKFNIHSSLVVNQYESGLTKVDITKGTHNEGNTNFFSQNHAGRLKSFIMNLKTVESLGWDVSWFQESLIYDKDLYNNEPYKVTILPDKKNTPEVPVFITQISDSEFMAEVDYVIKREALKIPIKFSQKGRFGEPFENNYFGFVLVPIKSNNQTLKNTFFIVNNLNNLASKYQKKIEIVSNEKQPDWIEMILSDGNLKRGVDYLNRLEEIYVNYGLEDKNRVAENTMKFIDRQLKSVTDSLSYSENKFTNFKSLKQAVNLGQESGIVRQRQETLESQKILVEQRIQYLKKLQNYMNDSKLMKQIVLQPVNGVADQSLNNLVVRLSDLYNRREVLSFSVKEKAPSLIMLDKEIQLTLKMLSENINILLSNAETELEDLVKRVGGVNYQLTLLPKTEQQNMSFKRIYDLNNELYSFLLTMRAESAIAYASNQPDVKIMDSAQVETGKQTSPLPLIYYSAGGILGLLLPFCILLFKIMLNESIQSKDEIEEMTNLPVVGMIIHNNSKKDFIVHENPRSIISESFRLLRTNLKYILDGDDKKVIAVQSTIAGEGKSFISINLASILAINNFKVLLVGVDMRMPTMYKALNSNNKKGLSTYLSNQDNFENIIEPTPINNLSYISSGPVPLNPAELLENGYFERFIDEAKSKFDYIILDSPPVSLVTDGFITGRHADINLFVLRFRFSSKEQIKSINEIEFNKTLRNPILVLNDAIKENFGNGNYYNKRNKGYYGG